MMNKQQKILITATLLFCATFVNAQVVRRIVSLTPSLTASVSSLDAEDRLVGCTTYCKVKDEQKSQCIGSAVNANIEKILILQPDLIVATSLTKPKTVNLLRKMGIKVEVFPTPKSFDEICSQFIRLGELIGVKPLATEIVAAERTKINSLQQSMTYEHKKVFFQIGAKPLYAVIPNTFMNDYITMAGCKNIASDLTKGTMTRESVIMRNPDVIFIATMGLAGEEEIAVWKRHNHLSAVQENKIFVIESEVACTPTPVNFTNTFEQILNCLKTNKL